MEESPMAYKGSSRSNGKKKIAVLTSLLVGAGLFVGVAQMPNANAGDGVGVAKNDQKKSRAKHTANQIQRSSRGASQNSQRGLHSPAPSPRTDKKSPEP